jgi:hypothetical protein
MGLSLILGFLWLILANVIAMFPSRDHHWRAAYVLIALGIPLVGWVTYTEGPVWGLIMLAAGASVLRWPLVYLVRWMKRKVAGPAE